MQDLFEDPTPQDVTVTTKVPGRRRSRIKLPEEEYKRLCAEVRRRDGHKCRCCGSRNQLHVHHVRFRSQGGDDATWNTLSLCQTCHQAVHQPNPRTGACLIIMRPDGEEGPIDANGPVKFYYHANWRPRKVN